MNKKFKRFISILLSVILAFSCCFIGTSAEDKDTNILRFTVQPEKAEYAKGETIVFNTSVTNKSLYILDDLIIFVEFDGNGTYLTPGITERNYSSVPYGGAYTGDFKLTEDETVVKIGEMVEKFNPTLGSIFKVLVHFYTTLSKTYVSLSEWFNTVKSGNIKNALKKKETATLGTSSVIYDGKEITCTFKAEYIINSERKDSTAEKKGTVGDAYTINATVTPENNALNGIVFGSTIKDGEFVGGMFYLDSETGSAGVATIGDDGITVLAQKFITLDSGKPYNIKLTYNDGYVKGWVYNNSLDTDPYPVFDIYTKLSGNEIGTFASASENVTNFTFTNDEVEPISDNTYTNPVYDNSPDPFILYDNGTYYLYATNRGDGFDVSTSTDLVNWTNQGACALMGDIIGTHWFWAPEVYRYNGKYYMLYSADEHLALAVADSPMGPFKKTSDNFVFDYESIDGHILFDDDGKKYLYYANFGDTGEEIWVCELDNNLNIKAETNKKLTEPSGWEGGCNEGPFVLKHNGYYYLTYSGEGYTSATYSVGVAISTSPTGPFVKQKNNPILYHTAYLNGTGHHCFVYTPSGEMMVAYHCHYSTTQVHARKLCINKAKFVPTESGIDELIIYCPTATPQEIPE